jgi:hypothetical protein
MDGVGMRRANPNPDTHLYFLITGVTFAAPVIYAPGQFPITQEQAFTLPRDV